MPQAIPFPPSPARQDRRRILNAASIRSIKAPAAGRVDYFDDATPGLSLRITANDVRTWTVFYSYPKDLARFVRHRWSGVPEHSAQRDEHLIVAHEDGCAPAG